MKSNRRLLLCLVLIASMTFTGCTNTPAVSPAPPVDDNVGSSVPVVDNGVELTVLNPTSAVEVVGKYAPRLDDLNGKRVAMWLASKSLDAGYDQVVYEKLAEKLKAEYPDIVIIPYTELPLTYSPQDEVVEELLAAKPDALIIGVGG